MNSLAEKTVRCPFCAERIAILLDLSAGPEQSYIEDCQVCCRPMLVSFTVVGDKAIGLQVDCAG